MSERIGFAVGSVEVYLPVPSTSPISSALSFPSPAIQFFTLLRSHPLAFISSGPNASPRGKFAVWSIWLALLVTLYTLLQVGQRPDCEVSPPVENSS